MPALLDITTTHRVAAPSGHHARVAGAGFSMAQRQPGDVNGMTGGLIAPAGRRQR